MLELFENHNLFKKDQDSFLKLDPQLASLGRLKYVHHSGLEQSIPVEMPGVYIVTGGRQVGKSTLLKLIIRRLLVERAVDPKQIFYLPCDTIETFQQLLTMIESFLDEIDPERPFFLFIDEVTYVKEWDRAIKALADLGIFKKGSVTITGSDAALLKDAMLRFPGRRGNADQADYHLYPLSFFETLQLYEPNIAQRFTDAAQEFRDSSRLSPALATLLDEAVMKQLYDYWDRFLVTGGFLTAINALAAGESIPIAVYQTYIQWIQGDLIKRGKNLDYARELLHGLIERLGSQLTWHSIATSVPIEHHQTIADYVGLLERMDVVHVLSALREDKMYAAPKKARKIHFLDPFIFHAVRSWCGGQKNAFAYAQSFLSEKSKVLDHFIEGILASLARRHHETFYLKAESEVDLALVRGKSFFPIEIKWTPTLRREDLRQLSKYKNGLIAAKTREISKLENMTVVPIPVLALLF